MMIGIGTPRSQSKIPRPILPSSAPPGANVDGQQTASCLNLFQVKKAFSVGAAALAPPNEIAERAQVAGLSPLPMARQL
jgi:hypothetical protein